MNTTIANWLQKSPLPKLEARMLLQKATGLTRVQLISRDDQILSTSELTQLTQWQVDRLTGQPMAYIMGEKEFFGRMFRVNPDVLIPRPETEHVIDEVLARLPENYPAKIADIGTGSGIIAITLKLERLLNHVFASDLSASALNVACLNAKDLHADIVFTQGSWFEGLDQIEQGSDFDFIVSNPPYIEKNDPHLQQGDVQFEPQMALTDFADGLEAYRVLTDQSYSRLKNGGWLIMEHGYDQGQAIRHLCEKYAYQNIATIKDLAGLDRVTVAQKIDQ